jgi:hypothetical protein
MPELSVTEEQLERLEALRAELEAAFVEGYGHVRRRDAVDYLLDTHTPPVEERVRSALDRTVRDEEGAIDYPALQSIARNTEGVKGSGMPAEEMYEAVLEAKVGEAEAEAGRPVDVGADPVEGGAEEVDTDEGGAEEVDADEGDDSGANGSSGTEPTNDEEERGSVAGDASSNGGSQLQRMMGLLNTHDDKWRKAESGDAPYEVDLPDGGTEAARTKDDVKRILFTNY